MSVTKKVLLVGLTEAVIDDARQRLRAPAIEFFVGTGIDDVRSAFARSDIHHVIMGAGIDLEARLEIVREVFKSSDTTTVHMKDRVSGPEGLMPFVQAVLRGLMDL